jgi:hypothetical protein
MPHIILKKDKDSKSLTFHGTSVSRTMKDKINEKLSAMHRVEGANPLQLQWDEVVGVYRAEMTKYYMQNHEEDAMAAILDSMEQLGWRLFTETSKGTYIFHKDERLML